VSNTEPTPQVSRRSFLHTGAAVAAVPLLGPRLSIPTPAETLRVANIGVGGMGAGDLNNVSKGKNVRIVALCDVDANRLGAAAKKHENAATFKDFRKLFDKVHKDIDAVVVSTPDHMHGSIAIAALSLGKHVYCQKPIAHNLYECRRMADLAREKRVVTQMGTQIHSHAAYRTYVATVKTGILGKISAAYCWVGKSWAGPAKGRPSKADKIPDYLDWDLWIGVAPERPYVNKIYHPARWRGWLDFGSGTLGDMGCHIFDPVFTALGIGAPNKVLSRGDMHHAETFAANSDILYEFPGSKRTTETLKLQWTDGKNARPAAARKHLPKDTRLPGSGSVIIGEHGCMVLPHWGMPKIYRDGDEVKDKLEKLPSKNHYHEWTDACRGEDQATTPFSYSGPLTEAVLLGTVAGRFPDESFTWDIEKMSFGDKKADALVKRTYRDGWEL
jgi:predicted dehydrogenase